MPTFQTQLWQCGLSIGNKCKGIPYFGGPRDDGNVNHGFRSLKEFPSKIIEIPEASEDTALLDVLKRANAKETPVFTIGCLSADVLDQPQGKRVTGYVEFALNARNLITDAVPYFQMFFHFHRRLEQLPFAHCVRFDWLLEPANFVDLNCGGFTCSVFVNTNFFPDSAAARKAWCAALQTLGDYLEAWRIPDDEKLYENREG